MEEEGLSFPEALEAVARRHRVHDPHPGARRHRRVPARADGAVSRTSAAGAWDHARSSSSALGQAERVSNATGFNMAVPRAADLGLRERRQRAARPGLAGAAGQSVPGDPGARGADRPRHQRRAHPQLRVTGHGGPLRPLPRSRLGRQPGRGPDLEARRQHSGRGAVARPTSGGASGWWSLPASAS